MENSNNTTVSWDYSDIETHHYIPLLKYVTIWIVVCVGLPLTVLAICALLFLVRNDYVIPIYIINLLISDVIQICCTTALIGKPQVSMEVYSSTIHLVSLMANIGFMVCVTTERYLAITWPLWYRFKRNIKVSVLVCVIVWLFPLALLLLSQLSSLHIPTTFAIFFFIPFPVLIFSVAWTLKTLSGVVSVSPEEKRRIVGTLVLVLFNYTLFFLPLTICLFVMIYWPEYIAPEIIDFLTGGFVRISPLADLILYVFMGKGALKKLLAFLCRR